MDVKDVTVQNQNYSDISILPANQTLYVRNDQADKPFELEIELGASDKEYEKIKPDLFDTAKALWPAALYRSSAFRVFERECADVNFEAYFERKLICVQD